MPPMNMLQKRLLALGASLCLDIDSHSPEDIIPPDELKKVGISAGLTMQQVEQILSDEEAFLKKKL